MRIEKWGADGAALTAGVTLGVAKSVLTTTGCPQLAGYVGSGISLLSKGTVVAGQVGGGAAIGGLAATLFHLLAVGGVIGLLVYAFSDD